MSRRRNASFRQRQLESRIIETFHDVPDIRFFVLNDNGQRAIQLIVSGPDQDVVIETAAKLQREMATIPTIEKPISTAPLDRPEIRITPEARARGRTRRLDRRDRRNDSRRNHRRCRREPCQVQCRRSADPDPRATPRQRPRGPSADRCLKVPAKDGVAVPLSAVADVEFGKGPTSIERYDRALRVALEGDLRGTDALGEVLDAVYTLPTAKNLPPGVTIKQTGDAEVMTRGLLVVRQGHGGRHHDGARRPDPALRQFPAAVHDPALPAAVDRRRDPGARDYAEGHQPARGDRLPDADGHRDQERDHAGRFRGRGSCQGDRP